MQFQVRTCPHCLCFPIKTPGTYFLILSRLHHRRNLKKTIRSQEEQSGNQTTNTIASSIVTKTDKIMLISAGSERRCQRKVRDRGEKKILTLSPSNQLPYSARINFDQKIWYKEIGRKLFYYLNKKCFGLEICWLLFYLDCA